MVCKKVVAVVVITYNSAKTVVETLNSIVSQTYGADFIELIISDDASVDNTTNVIEDWLEQHGSSFYSVMFLRIL
ncbi:glycosyltransferase family 2 protein [Aeromonas hydrophila]|nr:glycosyltransferase family 2 protein [Aeromonas hydrophila]